MKNVLKSLLKWKPCRNFATSHINIYGQDKTKNRILGYGKGIFLFPTRKSPAENNYNFLKIEGGEINKDIFKKLEDTEIWEFRTLFNGTCYRFFAFWDTELEALVVATHGIVKKTQKTPKKEIKKAEAIRKEYFDDKNKQ